MTITIYHNTACGTSRNVLGLIRSGGEEPHIIEYRKTPPSREEMQNLIDQMGISPRELPWDTLILSVVLYIVVPVILAQVWRWRLLAQGGQAALGRTLRRLGPLSLSALLLTLVLLFGLQGEQIMRQPVVILLLAVPIIIQVYFNAGLAYWLNRTLGVEWCVAGPSALIGASNFFELAVATAIALFGFQSGAALATVVGVLVEVPVMLSVVHILRRSRGWYERGGALAG
jgi:ACR3 family arsenite transporter